MSVLSTETRLGQAASSCCGHGGHSSRLPPCRGVEAVAEGPCEGPDVMSCPEEASASKPAQEGFWFLWAVLSCLSGLEGAPVVFCTVMLCV